MRFFANKWFWLCVIVVTVAVVWIPYLRFEYWAALAELDEARASIRQRGEPLTFADLRAENDSGYAVGDSATAILDGLNETDAEFDDLLRAGDADSHEDFAILQKALDANRAPLESLAALDGGSGRFRYDFSISSPMDTVLYGVEGLARAGNLWRAESLVSLRLGDADRAVHAILELCDTAEFLRKEPFIVSQLVRARIGGHGIDSLASTLEVVELTAAQVRSIDRRLADMEATFRLSRVIHAERASLYTTTENIGHPDVRESLGMMVGLGPGNAVQFFGPNKSSIDTWASLAFKPDLMRQQLWMLERMSDLAEWIDVPGVDAQKQWERNEQAISDAFESGEDGPVYELFPAVIYVRDKSFAYRQRLIAARLALRVANYRVVEGKLPASLDEVLDEDLPEIPPGFWAEAAPQYAPQPIGFQISFVVPTDEELNAGVVVSYQAGEGKNTYTP